jgi:Cu/Ag efflux protein CusF
MRVVRTLMSALLAALAVVGGASAQGQATGGAGTTADARPAQMADGEVRRVDKDAGRITIKHGPIKTATLDMDPMTMVFHVKDRALLDGVQTGDKIKFRVVSEDGGRMTVTEIQAVQ